MARDPTVAYDPEHKCEVNVQEMEYQDGLAVRVYQPAGAGPFPALVDVHGFDEPIRITIKGIKDRRTGQYRGFEVEVKAPPAMRARFRRVEPETEKIVIP